MLVPKYPIPIFAEFIEIVDDCKIVHNKDYSSQLNSVAYEYYSVNLSLVHGY